MTTLRSRLIQLEAYIQALVEGSAARFLQGPSPSTGYSSIRELAQQLEDALAANEKQAQIGDAGALLPDTAAVEVGAPAEPPSAWVPRDAFLIVNGARIFLLRTPVVNIGRWNDNQLVIDDRRVSRLHAQLRLVEQHYVIFDLASLGGTWVNGQRVTQCALNPGDVIMLAGVPLIYGQELTGASVAGQGI